MPHISDTGLSLDGTNATLQGCQDACSAIDSKIIFGDHTNNNQTKVLCFVTTILDRAERTMAECPGNTNEKCGGLTNNRHNSVYEKQ
jgi:hypothetical protein